MPHYQPDHDYSLRRIGEDGVLYPMAAYYLRGVELFRAVQLRLSNPLERFEGPPIGMVEQGVGSSMRVFAGQTELGDINVVSGVYTSRIGLRFQLEAIQL
ncbi:hypothetical protein [Pseudomonas sp. SCB32]|uniref:hypothetical protein n=1 Tax=Pseudomonas sp. SCB32 TaxID=2653853 RepID=UPI00126422C7|nr:hypothetical protein [Pseudomonas sp. SCB32]